MPGIIGFPQLDPGFVGGSRPPEPEEEPATSPEPMPTVPDPAVQDYENNLYHRLGLKPPRSQWKDFMAQYALSGWHAESDALAWATLVAIAESDWDEWLGHADRPLVEGVAQNLGDNTREGVVIIDAKTWDTLLDVTGVVGADGSQYVGLQDTDVEALKGLELVFVHNHTKEVGASAEDLESAFDAGAEVLIVITPSGREQVYLRGGGRMVLVRDEKASYEVGPENPEETEELRTKSEEQAAVFEVDSPEFIFRQDDPANMDVNPNEIAGYNELKHFVNTELVQLIGLSEEEVLREMVQSMELIEDIFGYTVQFHDTYDVGANVALTMKQVHDLSTILFHSLNTFGIKIMESTPKETIFVLGAEERIAKNPKAISPKNEGLVVLPQSTASDNPDLKKVYLGSEIAVGAIGHEVFHEVDRRLDGKLSERHYVDDDGIEHGVGGLEWFLKTKVTNRASYDDSPLGFNFGFIIDPNRTYLNEDSRGSDDEDNSEIAPDVLAAVVLDPLEEKFFSRADEHDPENRIGFALYSKNVQDLICGVKKYMEHIAGGATQPEEFTYDKDDLDACERYWSEQ